MKANLQNITALFFIMLFFCSCGQNVKCPIEQVDFEKARRSFYSSYVNAPNEIKKSAIFIDSRLHTCEFERKFGRSFTNWTGRIETISTDQGGDEIDAFAIISDYNGVPVYYKQFGVKQGSSLYNNIAEYKVGDLVSFGFSFNEESGSLNEKECFNELSITELGSLEEPEFSVNFNNIKPSEQ